MTDKHGGRDKGRYFFAVWPDDSLRAALVEWRCVMRTDPAARAVPADNLHMTVVFLGSLAPPQVDAVRRVAGHIPWSGASLQLDRVGYWPRSRVIWVGSRRGSERLAECSEQLRDRLRGLGFRIDSRHFVPHLTVYRKARRRPKWPERVLAWSIDELCLVRSHLSKAGAHYEIVDRWSARSDVE